MGTTPPTHACAVRFMNFCAETKFEKGASDRNSPTVLSTAASNCSDGDRQLAMLAIERRLQVGRLILPFTFTWSEAPAVSYCGPLLSSSKADDSLQPENRQLYASLRLVLPPCGYTSLLPHPLHAQRLMDTWY